MKKQRCVIMTSLFVMVMTGAVPIAVQGQTSGPTPALPAQPPVQQEPESYNWQDKLKRGALNIVTSPVEIAREIQLTSQEKNLLQGWTLGLVKGLGHGVLRLGAGVIDVLTCPFNFPDSNKGPLVDPEYVWQKPGVRYT